jgi:hypothetical protein
MAASCSRPLEKPASHNDSGKSLSDASSEQSSLLDLTRGATIVSRTGESVLPTSAINVIDGVIGSFWAPPPHDYPQSIVIALGTPSRIDRVGFRSRTEAGYEANHVVFERSQDGSTWQPVTTMTSRGVDDGQWLNVPPFDAAYLRVTIPDSKNATRDAHLQSVLAHGTEIAARTDPSIGGCWAINENGASFTQLGTRATGVVAQGSQTVFLAGGTTGRMWRFNWIRGNDYGYTALTVSPDGKKLSAVNWHEEAIPLFTAIPWFGERSDCAALPPATDVPLALLHRSGRVSLFALQFDAGGTLIVDSSRDELNALRALILAVPIPLRITAHEFRQPDAQRNQEVSEREIASLRAALSGADLKRVDFAAAGSSAPRQLPASDPARSIYSSVELEVRR